MAMNSMEPAKTASKAKWESFLEDQGIDVPANASRADLIDLWNLHAVDGEPDDDADVTAAAKAVLDFKPSPTEDVAVDEDLDFTTSDGSEREPEKIVVHIDGRPHYLYEPSLALLLLNATALSSDQTPFEDRIRTVMDLVNACLDTDGVRTIRRAMYSRDTVFDLNILGKLVAVIYRQWAPNENVNTDMEPKRNRAQRRQTARR